MELLFNSIFPRSMLPSTQSLPFFCKVSGQEISSVVSIKLGLDAEFFLKRSFASFSKQYFSMGLIFCYLSHLLLKTALYLRPAYEACNVFRRVFHLIGNI